ncbi:MAG: T9SS type A sorting domain-containing protein, partial [Bacteroidetes bacterium]|nr:T9SS type A sorting domain-containing protein [Bacteroidota bacterium]
MADSTSWSVGSGWTIENGVAKRSASAGFSKLIQNIAFTEGEYYSVTFDFVDLGSGARMFTRVNDTWSSAFTGTGTKSVILIAGVTSSGLMFEGNTDSSTVDNVIVELVSITITTPNGGEIVEIGSSLDITWNDNIPDNNLVKIELYKGGSLNTVLFEAEDADGSKRWTIDPAITPGTDYRIKVISVDDNNVFDISDADFTISRSNITVTSPNGGESWQAGSSQSINWTDDFSENVLIELYKGGSFHSTIVATTASDGSKIWNIPFTLESGTDYSVKIAKVGDPNVFDFSDNNFTIVGNQVTVTSPNGGEDWQVGSSQIITWTDNLTGNVELQLFKGGVFNSSIITSTASDGVFTWNIPGTTPAGSDYKVNIISVDDGNVFDLSDANFTLSNELIVTIPNGGESWQAGTSHTINWTDNITGNVKIELYDNGSFDSEITPSTPSNGSFSWDIPVSTSAGTNYKVKISSVDNSSIFDLSDNNFEIFEGNITIVSPNGGESWQAGTTQSITWTDNINENVTIDLYKGGSFHSVISTSTGSDGSKIWDIPFTLESGTDYKVRIGSEDNASIFDFSDADFTIFGNQVSVTSPNGGEDWQVSSSQIITWTDNLIGRVEIQLFKGGVFHSSITTSTPSDGSYTWNISSSLVQASDYNIKITSVDDNNIFDFSDGDFTLSNTIIVVVPNGSENWQQGTQHNINWTDNVSGNVKIELYKGGVYDSEITPSTTSSGSYTWNIPITTAPGSDYKVKISSVNNASVFDFSDANFEIFSGNITVVSPNGSESWQAGTTQTIMWTDNINENVKIDLYKGGLFHSAISTSTSSDGSKTWNIPFTLESGSDYSILITSVDDPAVTDFSDADFTIVSNQITVISPNGGENWLDTENQIITWTDNLLGNVEIQLFKGGSFHSSITTSTPSDGAYTWNIPGTTPSGSDYSVKIISVDEGNVFDLSDGDFTIINNDITVNSPNGGESWLTGNLYEITWTDANIGNIKIELYKSEVFNSIIVSSTPSDGSYFWDIPVNTATGSDYKVKITNLDQPILFDFSNSAFTIFTGNITLTLPNGSENLQAGTSQNITWTDNISENVTIDLYKSGLFHSVISTSTSSDGSKNWDIPFALESGSDYTVKITSVDNPNLFDFSDADFSIIGNQITVTSPDGGEDYQVGTSQIIAWTDNLTGNVEIQLHKGGVFHSSIVTSTASDGAYTWNISTSLVQGSDYRIRISSIADGNIFDFSDADFTLSNEIIVTIPNGGESWQAGTLHNIIWTDNITGNVKIELYKDGVFDSEITSSTPSTSNYNWNIPPGTAAGSDYKVKILNVDNNSVLDFSDANFTIFTGNITVVTPNGGENWQAGITQTITWNDNITENVTIDLYKGGTFHSSISTTTGSDGSKTWAIPFSQEAGNDYTVKITSVDDPGITDFSDADFTIVGNQVTVISPKGGENWLDSDDQIISWSDNLTGNVEIQLLKSGLFHSSITTSTPSDGSFTWNIPGATSSGSDYKIKIISVDDGNIFGISDADFTIINNNITVLSPNGGESWLIGSTHEITWNDDIDGDVLIELIKGESPTPTFIASVPSNGFFTWNIPDSTTPGSDYKIKITSVAEPAISDISNNNFTLFTGFITVASPNGGENWQAGTTKSITWVDNITENVKIELFKGGVFHSEISNLTNSDGSKTWDIPFGIESGSDYKVKITKIDDDSTYDFSDEYFTIVGNQITVTSPNGGESWLDNEDQIISWNDNLTGNVAIQLFKGGSFHSIISTSTASSGSFPWNIPGSLESGSDYKIRISSVADGSVFDFSDENFTIINNNITVTSPNGGENWLTGSIQTITWTDDIIGDVKIELFKTGVFHSTIISSTPSNGSFVWNIPGSTPFGLDYKIKITSVVDTILFDESNNDFIIFTGAITMVSPSGGEIWQAGTTQTIIWTDNISENVKIELFKSGVFHSSIINTTSSDGSKTWDIPFGIESGLNYKIKITKIDDDSTFDFSDANFEITGFTVTVNTPNGGEIWLDTEDHIIEWTSNLTGNVEIQLFKSGVFRSTIVSSTSNDGSFSWNIPGSIESGSDYKVQIASVNDGNINDQSDSNFTIISDNITLVAPNGGENWLTGTSQNITWIDDIVEDVRIDLYKGGAFSSTIVDSTPSTGSYNWTIPGTIEFGLDYMVKISSVVYPILFDMSNNNFTIFTGDITITSPNGGENWQANSAQVITWTDNITENVRIELLKSDTLRSTISPATTSDGSKVWTIPFDLESGSDYKIKIISVDNENTIDISDSEFTITGFKVTVISPNGGEDLLIGSEQIITWTDNLVGNVEIQLFKGGVFHSQLENSTASDGSFIWNISPALLQGSDYSIMILSVNDGNIFDISDTSFTLSSEIIVNAPNGSEVWQAGTQQNITWTDNIVGDVKIDLYKNEVYSSTIVASTPSNGTYQWMIADDLQPDSDYKLKIISVNDGSISDMSDSNFTIEGGSITVTSPNSGEIWQAGTPHPITWIDNINENVKIELYKGGSFHSAISTSTSSDGTNNWDIPFDLETGTNYKIKITSVNNSDITDYSDNNFSILGNHITVTSPNGGEVWLIGSAHEITWEDNLDGNVQILLLKADQLHLIISSSTASDGSRPWTVPSVPPGSDYKIRISSVTDGNIFDESDADFTIDNTTGIEDLASGIPDIYELYQNYPNPFNPSTKIEFGLPEESNVSLRIYDITGQEVEVVLNNESFYPGTFRYDFNASNLPSGVYFYILIAES